MAPTEPPLCDKHNSRDECQHGSLRRKCEICERDTRIAELERWQREAAPYVAVKVREWRYKGVSDSDKEMVKMQRLLAEAGCGDA